ncbi:MAG: four helix bundle protein [Clostridia bacterium]|nr:four helix bundle protein [Clostridia bacterium]
MDAHQLPVYNSARQLYIQLERSTQKVPRNFRMHQLSQLQELVFGIMENIIWANKYQEEDKSSRHEFIMRSLRNLNFFEVRVRIYYDLHIIGKEGYAAIMRLEADVERQLNGWAESTKC